MVAPTIQWVPEIGSFKNEATSCHTAEPEIELIKFCQVDSKLLHNQCVLMERSGKGFRTGKKVRSNNNLPNIALTEPAMSRS